jgi:hypothetical protein
MCTVLEILATSASARVNKVGIRKCYLGILVQVLHVRMGWSVVEVEVVFLDVFAVFALTVGKAEQAFLEDEVLTVPEGQGEAESLLITEMPARPSSPQR